MEFTYATQSGTMGAVETINFQSSSSIISWPIRNTTVRLFIFLHFFVYLFTEFYIDPISDSANNC